MDIDDYIIIISSLMFSTPTQSICFFPNSIFKQSEAFSKRFWRNEKLTKFQCLGKQPKLWRLTEKVCFEGLFEKITYQITRAYNLKTKLVSNNIKLKLISYNTKKLKTRSKN